MMTKLTNCLYVPIIDGESFYVPGEVSFHTDINCLYELFIIDNGNHKLLESGKTIGDLHFNPLSEGKYYIIFTSPINESCKKQINFEISCCYDVESFYKPSSFNSIVMPSQNGKANGYINLSNTVNPSHLTVVWRNEKGDIVGNQLFLGGLSKGKYCATISSDNCEAPFELCFTIIEQKDCKLDFEIGSKITNSCDCKTCPQGAIKITNSNLNTNQFSFQWSNGETTKDLSGIKSGTYSLVLTQKSTGCTKVQSFIVAEGGSWGSFDENSCTRNYTCNGKSFKENFGVFSTVPDEAGKCSGTVYCNGGHSYKFGGNNDKPNYEYVPDSPDGSEYCFAQAKCKATGETFYVGGSWTPKKVDCRIKLFCDIEEKTGLAPKFLKKPGIWTGKDYCIWTEKAELVKFEGQFALRSSFSDPIVLAQKTAGYYYTGSNLIL